MKNLLYAMFVTLLMVAVIGCNNNEDDDPDPDNNQAATPSMTVIKDGVTFEVPIRSFNNLLTLAEDRGRGKWAFSMFCLVDGGEFNMNLVNWDFQNPPSNGLVVKDYPTNWRENVTPLLTCLVDSTRDFCDGGQLNYQKGGEFFGSSFLSVPEVGVISITANDTVKQTISGSFNGKVDDISGTQIIELSGTFQNIPYAVF